MAYTKNDREREKRRFFFYRKMLNSLRNDGCCSICGYSEHPEILVFHHVNPKEKKFLISIGNIRRKDFWDEYHKCMLLCPNCHALVHLKDK